MKEFIIITGKSGIGKTTIRNSIINYYEENIIELLSFNIYDEIISEDQLLEIIDGIKNSEDNIVFICSITTDFTFNQWASGVKSKLRYLEDELKYSIKIIDITNIFNSIYG